MSASPAEKRETEPATTAVAAPPPAQAAPAAKATPAPARRPSPVAAAVLSILAGIIVMLGLAVGYAVPATLPVVAPIVVLISAVGLWGAARIDHGRLAADLARLSAENRRLSASLELVADAAWELRESEELRTLVEARRRAEAANQAKSRLIATVSHEFRTPLNGILGLNDLLLESPLSPDQRAYAEGVRSSGTALLALVDDMLDFSKIEAGRLDLRPERTAIEPLLQDIAELLAARAHGRGIDIAARAAPDVPFVLVDAARLRQVVLNLAGNAVKFTEAGGVTLTAHLESRDGARVRIAFAVSDTGPGIAPADAERIFGEFEQADSATTRRHNGAGLGLAISRRIVRQMGGDVAVGPAPEGGAAFRFTLDLPLAGDMPHAPRLDDRRILVLAAAGAEPAVLAALIADAGGDARIVHTPMEGAALAAAAAAAGLPYHALLVDRRAAPDVGATLARIREGADLPAALLVAPGERAAIEEARAAGFDAYLVKPVRRASLLRVAGEMVTARGAFHGDPTDAPADRAPEARRSPAHLRVLVAEDNEINLLLVRAVLEGLGHSVAEAADGDAAVAVATTGEAFDAILMDLHMPGRDGCSAALAIRAHEKANGRPRAAIFALTADVLAETRARATEAGIDAVLAKPVAPEALRRMLAGLAA
ncbi:MAG: response regulator [Rhizobiales bacterium]|nr:response regulator [Hyphomicrobiales bacterium]